MRVFLGLPVQGIALDKMSREIEKFKYRLPECRWVNKDNLHLTLKFYGEKNDEEILEIINQIDTAVLNTEMAGIELNELSMFNKRDRIIFFAETSKPGWIIRIIEKLDRYFDYKRFTAHITIGRLKIKPKIKIKTDEFLKYYNKEKNVFNNIKIDKPHIVLYESILKPSGPEYKIIKEWNKV